MQHNGSGGTAGECTITILLDASATTTFRRICDIYDFFAPHINVLTYLLTYLGLHQM